MNIPPTTNQPTFGILKGYRKTSYGQYMWGVYRKQKIEVFDADQKHGQKLQYVSEITTLRWIKSKLVYLQNGIKHITKSENGGKYEKNY